MWFDDGAPACKEQDQSPINLSESTALPCKRKCEWKVNDMIMRKATMNHLNALLFLYQFSDAMTATYNDDAYNCVSISMYNPAQHKLENGDGHFELVASFTNPSKKRVNMSVIINGGRSSAKTPSDAFFKAIANAAESTTVTFDEPVSLQSILPEDLSFFKYEGRDFRNCSEQCTWIVYKTPIGMDPTTHSKLLGKIFTARYQKPIQQISINPQEHERKVYFKDTTDMNPAYKKDGKVYLRCRRLPPSSGGGRGKSKKEGFIGGNTIEGLDGGGENEEDDAAVPEDTPDQVKSGGLIAAKDAATRAARSLSTRNMVQKMYDYYISIGGFFGLLTAITIVVMTAMLATVWSPMPIKLLELTQWPASVIYHLRVG